MYLWSSYAKVGGIYPRLYYEIFVHILSFFFLYLLFFSVRSFSTRLLTKLGWKKETSSLKSMVPKYLIWIMTSVKTWSNKLETQSKSKLKGNHFLPDFDIINRILMIFILFLRGDHIVPNMDEAFPKKSKTEDAIIKSVSF